MTTARVFISYSQGDAGVAAALDRVLREHNAATFIGYEGANARKKSPERVREGIAWCNRFLLLWSIHAARSTEVLEQWDQAYGQDKQILPYLLDECPLPDVLEGDMFIVADDQHRGHGQLLAAVFQGYLRKADLSRMFHGAWCATLAIDGTAEVTHDLELLANGQIVGKGLIGQSGKLAHLIRKMSMAHLLNLHFAVRGEWVYKDFAQTLTLDFTVEGVGEGRREIIQIKTTGSERHPLIGEDEQGRTWTFERPLGINAGSAHAFRNSPSPVED
jgi:hypothetical protein